jgi:uncharacterized protein (TIGR02145 family)
MTQYSAHLLFAAVLSLLILACGDDKAVSPTEEVSSSSLHASSSSVAQSSSSFNEPVPCASYDASTHFCDERDGTTYPYVTMGTQVWMAENLNHETSSGSWCYKVFEMTFDGCATYGRLYDWPTALSACPAGWRLPNDADWDELMATVNGCSAGSIRCPDAGTLLKASTGWNALLGGRCSPNHCDNAESGGYWWSASEYDSGSAYNRHIFNETVGWEYTFKDYGFSVRCVRD